MKKLLLARKPIKVNEIPEGGLVGELIDIEEGKHGPIYILKDEAGQEHPIYNCADLRGIKEKHIGRKLKIVYKGQPYLEQGNKKYEAEVQDLSGEV